MMTYEYRVAWRVYEDVRPLFSFMYFLPYTGTETHKQLHTFPVRVIYTTADPLYLIFSNVTIQLETASSLWLSIMAKINVIVKCQR